jgi:hypothetical protein
MTDRDAGVNQLNAGVNQRSAMRPVARVAGADEAGGPCCATGCESRERLAFDVI